MLTSRRDYLLRIIDEVGRLLARLVQQRRKGQPEDALQSLADAFARLFGREFQEVFQFTPDQHYLMLAAEETDEVARDKRLLYAALSAEAGRIYADLGRTEYARASTLNALRFSLRARQDCPGEELPAFAPLPASLVAELGAANLDPATAALWQSSGLDPGPAGKLRPGPAPAP